MTPLESDEDEAAVVAVLQARWMRVVPDSIWKLAFETPA